LVGDLDDRSVVVTGAGQGLGRAYAVAAAAAGASVVVNDIDDEAAHAVVGEIVDNGAQAVACCGSVADPNVAVDLIMACQSHFGRVDGLVNNAAISAVALPWDEDLDRVRRIIDVNVVGSLQCGIEALRVMRKQGSGTIVNVTSGAFLGMPGVSTYAASKGAITSMTQAWAIDGRDFGIRVNAISPMALTQMSLAGTPKNVADRAEPAEVAPAVVYLLGDRSAPLTGAVLRFDGRRLQHLVPARMELLGEAGSWTPETIGGTVGPVYSAPAS
jgi:NAD(P)-dependent dehydrogenase (short-subunit alcohol dehydrogenase family)